MYTLHGTYFTKVYIFEIFNLKTVWTSVSIALDMYVYEHA